MASVKVKFRSSTIKGVPGTIFFQVIHQRVARQKKTDYVIYPHEWDVVNQHIILSDASDNRKDYLKDAIEGINEGVDKLLWIIDFLEQKGKIYTADDVINLFSEDDNNRSFFCFAEMVISRLVELGKERRADAYSSSLSSFKRFRNNKNITLANINPELMMAYEAYLKTNDISPNSSSFYMRNLRAVYNKAVEEGLVTQREPFKHVYTGVEKTMKRAISLKIIRLIRTMELKPKSAYDFARDMFLFSFYTRGMSFVDMAYLKKKDLSHGVLSYRRKKTGQQLFIRWEKCMEEIVVKYQTEESEFLLPIIRAEAGNERKQYLNEAHNINRNLKYIGSRLGLSIPLTMYVARHTWASIAKSKHIPLSVISEGMGHDSERTTRIYLTSLNNAEIDKANRLILKLL